MKPASKTLPTKLIDKVRRGVKTVAYGNPLYQRIISSGENIPDRLRFTLLDVWPGDAEAGRALISGQGALFDLSLPQRHAVALRNLRAVGSDAARQRARALIEHWLQRYDHWNDVEWAPDVMGERIGAWIGSYEFFASNAAPEFIQRLTISLHRQYKHLVRTVSPGISGVEGLRAIKGLVLCALNFDEGDKALGLAAELIHRQLAAEILPDGGVRSRSPSAQLHMARHMIDLRSIFKAAGIEVPVVLNTSIHAMIPALKMLRHGDGGLALFHGSHEESPLLIDAVITQFAAKGRVIRRMPNMGYERFAAGRSLLIADCGAPPPRDHDAKGHAGLLGFEFGQGRERLIVNCGAVAVATDEWRKACAATAAHSTITIEDTNACEILETGGLGSAAHVTAHRFEQNGAHCLEMTHDAYRPQFGIVCQRRLCLSADGDELQGVDTVSGAVGCGYAVRWHLHPSLQASIAHSGQTALLRTPSGNGWRLRIEGRDLSLEPSVYCGSGAPRRSLQIKVSGKTTAMTTEIIWNLTKEKKG